MIDASYFAWRDVRIPNIAKVCKDRNNYVVMLMNSKMEESLRRVLGVCLYEELKTNLDGWELKDDAEEKWKKLLYGEIYDAPASNSGCCCCGNCKKHQWMGLVDKLNKRSLIAYYTYNQWAHENESQSFGTGEQVASVNNSETVSNKIKRVNAWNNFVNWAQFGYADGRVSLYEYIADKKDDFPEWAGECFKHENVWSI